jgi:hypothetical protein
MLNEKNRVKSNMYNTMEGQGTSKRRIPTNDCIPFMKTFMPETTDKMGGKSMEDDIPTKRISPNKANPKSKGSCAEGQRRHTKLSMKNPLQHLTQPKAALS